MRILVMFDLPVKNEADKKVYIKFRRFLLNDGYFMLQYSVYSRICNGWDGAEKHIKRLEANLPNTGSVRVLSVTEKQYTSMKILKGKIHPQEKLQTDSEQLSIFDIF